MKRHKHIIVGIIAGVVLSLGFNWINKPNNPTNMDLIALKIMNKLKDFPSSTYKDANITIHYESPFLVRGGFLEIKIEGLTLRSEDFLEIKIEGLTLRSEDFLLESTYFDDACNLGFVIVNGNCINFDSKYIELYQKLLVKYSSYLETISKDNSINVLDIPYNNALNLLNKDLSKDNKGNSDVAKLQANMLENSQKNLKIAEKFYEVVESE